MNPRHKSEDKLILSLARTALSDEVRTQTLALLKQNLSWDYILKTSRDEGVSCLLYEHVKNEEFSKFVPEEFLKEFESDYYHTCQRNLLVYESAKEIFLALNQYNIKAIALKGLYLAQHIYGNIGLRPMTDIDILISKDDFWKTKDALASIGYEPILNAKDAFNRPLAYALAYHRRGGLAPFSLDVHWHFLSSTWLMKFLSPAINLEKIWAQAEIVKIDDQDVLTLCPSHNLIYLAQHAFAHSFEKLLMLTDILETAHVYADLFSGDQLLSKAKELHLDNILEYSSCLLRKKMGKGLGNLRYTLSDALCASVQERVQFYGLPCIIYLLTQRRHACGLPFRLVF